MLRVTHHLEHEPELTPVGGVTRRCWGSPSVLEAPFDIPFDEYPIVDRVLSAPFSGARWVGIAPSSGVRGVQVQFASSDDWVPLSEGSPLKLPANAFPVALRVAPQWAVDGDLVLAWADDCDVHALRQIPPRTWVRATGYFNTESGPVTIYRTLTLPPSRVPGPVPYALHHSGAGGSGDLDWNIIGVAPGPDGSSRTGDLKAITGSTGEDGVFTPPDPESFTGELPEWPRYVLVIEATDGLLVNLSLTLG